jgi:hypothetical protein
VLAVAATSGRPSATPGVTGRDELALVLWSSPTRDPASRPACHIRGSGLGAAPSGLRACTWNRRLARHGQLGNRRAGDNEQRLLRLARGRATYNGTRTGRPAARQPRKPGSMSVQPQHQNNSRALVSPGSADRRRSSAPAYYLGRPASLWIGIASPARQAQRTRTSGGRHHR